MKKRSRTPRIVLTAVITVLVVAGLAYFGYVFFKAETVEVLGNGKYTTVYIQSLAGIDPETHMLMLDVEEVKRNIEEAEPYLEVLGVEKQLPQTVLVTVRERQPKAYISYAQNYLLSDRDANVLEILTALPEARQYPVAEGFVISGASLGKQIVTEDLFKITVMGEILDAMDGRTAADFIISVDL
jgi:cell division septal protein FtsQ